MHAHTPGLSLMVLLAFVIGCAGTSQSRRSAARQTSQDNQASEEESLAAAARDPTASVTAFQIRYDQVSSFHDLSGATQSSLVLQPIIPFSIGGQRHIARITVPFVVDGPDWGMLALAPPEGIPPNYVPTADKTGVADTALVDLLIYDAPWEGRWGVGMGAVLPTASDPALGSEKWSLGPAAVALARAGDLQYGILGQWIFSVAGDSNRADVNVLALQPFASYGLGNDWSIGTSELTYNYDFEDGSWATLPLGGRIEKLIHIGNLPVRVYLDVEYNFWDRDVGPEWTWRFALVPLF